jgi:hypothetical protein
MMVVNPQKLDPSKCQEDQRVAVRSWHILQRSHSINIVRKGLDSGKFLA